MTLEVSGLSESQITNRMKNMSKINRANLEDESENEEDSDDEILITGMKRTQLSLEIQSTKSETSIK